MKGAHLSFLSQALVLATCLATLLSSVGLVAAQAHDTPEVNVQTTFPNNAFSRVSNGQANRVVFTVTQPRSGVDSDRILTLESITGAFLNRDREGKKGYVLRNMTVQTYKSLPVKATDGKPLQVPYDFYPEFKPQQLGVEFRVTLKDAQTNKKHNIHAYTGSVTVVEPPKSWFDVQLLSLYALLAGIVSTAIYWASQNFPGSRTIDKRKQRSGATKSSVPKSPSAAEGKTSSVSASALSASAPSGATKGSSYDEDWIPAQHLRKSGGSNSPRPRANKSGSSRK